MADSPPAARWVENRASTRRVRWPSLRELVAHRELAVFLALRDLQLRYKQTFFGVSWAILQPLAGALIFTLVFGRLTKLPSARVPYVIFVFAGFSVWTYFAVSLEAAANSLVEDEALVTKVYFPRILGPWAAVLPSLLDLALALVILGIFMAVLGVPPGLSLLALPVCVAALVVLTAGIGSFLAALNVRYRDVRYALTFGLQTWLFASPVVYSSSLVDGALAYAYALNPMVGMLDAFRWSLLDGPAPGPEALVSLATGVLALLVGLAYFGRTERTLADAI